MRRSRAQGAASVHPLLGLGALLGALAFAMGAGCIGSPFSMGAGGSGSSGPTSGAAGAASGSASSGASASVGSSSSSSGCSNASETACSGVCVDLQTSAANCGSCGHACMQGDSCAGGQCLCKNGLLDCNGVCLDGSIDAANCGKCGNRCDIGAVCKMGACFCAGTLMCPKPSPGVCTQITGAGDPRNCGVCGHGCMDSEVCINGMCTCRFPLTRCSSGACVDTGSDPSNCGGCGAKCAQGESCVAASFGAPGVCTPVVMGAPPCPPTYTDCGGGSCVLTSTMKGDPVACGACNSVCAQDEVCTMGGTCVKYFASPSCTTCPCLACGLTHKCCMMGGVPLCVAGGECGF